MQLNQIFGPSYFVTALEFEKKTKILSTSQQTFGPVYFATIATNVRPVRHFLFSPSFRSLTNKGISRKNKGDEKKRDEYTSSEMILPLCKVA